MYFIFQLINFRGREVAQEGGEILPKVSQLVLAQIRQKFVSLNFTKTATLKIMYQVMKRG